MCHSFFKKSYTVSKKKISINKHSCTNTDRPHRTLYAHDLTRSVMIGKIKKVVDKLLLILTVKTNFPINFFETELFCIFKTKSSLSTPVLIFSAISKNLKTKFYVFWLHTCRNLKIVIMIVL